MSNTNIGSINQGGFNPTIKGKSKGNNSSLMNITDSFKASGKVGDSSPGLDAKKVAKMMSKNRRVWDLEKLWSTPTEGRIFTKPNIGPDGSIAVGTNTGKLFVVDGKTGKKKWNFEMKGDIRWSVFGKDGTVYTGGSMSEIHALDGKTGEEKWSHNLDQHYCLEPVIGPAGNMYIGDSDNLYSIDTKTGQRKWKQDFSLYQMSYSPVIADSDTIIMSGGDITFTVDANTGKQKDDYGYADYHHNPALKDGVMFVAKGRREKSMLAIDQKTKETKWQTDIDGWLATPPVIGKNGVMYAAVTSNDKIIALDEKTGKKKWEFKTRIKNDAFVVLNEKTGTVMSVNKDNNEIIGIDADNGKLKWRLSHSNRMLNAPMVGNDGTIYVGDGDGNVHAFREKEWKEDLQQEYSEIKDDDGESLKIEKGDGFVVIGGVRLPAGKEKG
ncbi:MAG: PQQ-binding-like beta-propeller repeat protein [Candidatus Eremiobacteraeota bacterium]|nr:PQQ-binding-like beta-propeller repeat protein [Candidatus Eremiobacteraeota bacterium]